jgi:rare lipoprotein A
MKKKIAASFLVIFFSVGILFAQTSKGFASYYANKFSGRRTTSGEKYNPDSLTAAHKSLAFGTMVKVTNLKNGKSAVVKINDRLPKKSKRIIDLSKKAAKELEMIQAGIVKVELEVVSDK